MGCGGVLRVARLPQTRDWNPRRPSRVEAIPRHLAGARDGEEPEGGPVLGAHGDAFCRGERQHGLPRTRRNPVARVHLLQSDVMNCRVHKAQDCLTHRRIPIAAAAKRVGERNGPVQCAEGQPMAEGAETVRGSLWPDVNNVAEWNATARKLENTKTFPANDPMISIENEDCLADADGRQYQEQACGEKTTALARKSCDIEHRH